MSSTLTVLEVSSQIFFSFIMIIHPHQLVGGCEELVDGCKAARIVTQGNVKYDISSTCRTERFSLSQMFGKKSEKKKTSLLEGVCVNEDVCTLSLCLYHNQK